MDDEKAVGSTILLLTHPSKPDQSKKVEAYTFLTSLLKGKSCKAAIDAKVFSSREEIIEVILSDICIDGRGGGVMSQLVPHALQTLGYLLFNERLARNLNAVIVSRIIEGICDLAKKSSMVKSVCTHCLWCLANQNLDKRLLGTQVSLISSTINYLIILTETLPSPSTVSEVVNVLEKLFVQCADDLMKIAKVWYEPMVAILFSKYTKVHQKVLNFLVTCEPLLSLNSSLVFWLGKELKNHLITTMLNSLSSKRLDHYVMLTWAHFVSILGKALHLSGTFLNRMLKVVEMGFKHVYKPVQIAAYTAWKNVIDNFSANLDLIKTPKKLDLLLLPLVSSALKCRDKEVDRVRVVTWWHLIVNLLACETSGDKTVVFKKVCLPMILFCLGLNPKTDIFTSFDSTTSECIPPRWNFATLFEPSSNSSSVPSSTHYPFTPTAGMLYSAGHAILQLIGHDVSGTGFTLKPLLTCSLLSFESVSLSALPYLTPSLLLVAEGLSTYGSLLEPLAVQPFFTNLLSFVVTYLKKHGKEPFSDQGLLVSLIDLLDKSTIIDIRNKMDLLSQLRDMPLVGILVKDTPDGQQYWQRLQKMILTYLAVLYPSNEYKSNLLELYGKVNAAVCSSQRPEQQLAVYRKLFDVLESAFPTQTEDTRALLGQCWCVLADGFTSFLKQVGIVNEGSSIQPDFSLVLKILEFPFRLAIPRSDEQSSTVLQTWKKLFYSYNVNVGLTVKDFSLAIKLASDGLLPAAKMAIKDLNSSSSSGDLVDGYLTALACSCQLLVVKLFSSPTRKENFLIRKGELHTTGPVATIHSLCSLISWQLNESSLILSEVTDFSGDTFSGMSANIMLEIVSKLYTSLTSAELLQHTTETLSAPLSRVLKTVLSVELSNSKLLRELHKKSQIVWSTICSQFNLYWEKNNTNEVLRILSPLLAITFRSNMPMIIDPTVLFWNCKFGVAESLDYPPLLRNAASYICSEVASRIKLPPHSGQDDETVVIGEMVAEKEAQDDVERRTVQNDLENKSDMMEVEESEPFILYPNPSSSAHAAGISKRQTPMPSPSTKGRTPITNQKPQRFVVVSPLPNQAKRLLTQHQKEKRRERSYIPPLYNSLESSQTTQPLSPLELSELPVATTSSSCAPQTADAVTVSAPQNDSPAPPSISSMSTSVVVPEDRRPLVSASPELVSTVPEDSASYQATKTATAVGEEDTAIAEKPTPSDVIDLTDSLPLAPFAYNSSLDDSSQTSDISQQPSSCTDSTTVSSPATSVSSLVSTPMLPVSSLTTTLSDAHMSTAPLQVSSHDAFTDNIPMTETLSSSIKPVDHHVKLIDPRIKPVASPFSAVESVNPVLPVSSASPVEPVNPVLPVSSASPVEPANSVLPVSSASPVEPANSVLPVSSASLVEPVNPVLPVSSASLVEPANPVLPVSSASLVEPVIPVLPVSSASSVEPANPVLPVSSASLVEPVIPVLPVSSASSVEPVLPVSSASPVEPVNPVLPVHPVPSEVASTVSSSLVQATCAVEQPATCAVEQPIKRKRGRPRKETNDSNLKRSKRDTEAAPSPVSMITVPCVNNPYEKLVYQSLPLVLTDAQTSHQPPATKSSSTDHTSFLDHQYCSFPIISPVEESTVKVVGSAISESLVVEVEENIRELSQLLNVPYSSISPPLTSGQQQPKENYPVVSTTSSEAHDVEAQQIAGGNVQENAAVQEDSTAQQEMECVNEQQTRESDDEQTQEAEMRMLPEETSDQRISQQEDVERATENIDKELRMTEEESGDQRIAQQDDVIGEPMMTDDEQMKEVAEGQRMMELDSNEQTTTRQDEVAEDQRMTEEVQTSELTEKQRTPEQDDEEWIMVDIDQITSREEKPVSDQEMAVEDTEEQTIAEGQDPEVERILDKEELLGIVEESEQDVEEEGNELEVSAEESKQPVEEECTQETSMLEGAANAQENVVLEEETDSDEEQLNEEVNGVEREADNDIVEESEEPELTQETGDTNKDTLPAAAAPSSPTNCPTIGPFSPVTPIGILKHVSRYDSPTSANKERRVQFATPVIAAAQDPPPWAQAPSQQHHYHHHSKPHKKSSRHSRRSLQMSPQSTNKLTDSPSSPSLQSVSLPTQPPKAAIFPLLIGCNTPIDTILPSLSTSGNSTYGLKSILCSQNITTISDISSLSPEEVEKLPIKTPKQVHLWSALKSFEVSQEEIRRKSSKKRPRDNQSNESVSKKHKTSRFLFTSRNETRSSTDEEPQNMVMLEDGRETEETEVTEGNVEAEQLEDKQDDEEMSENMDTAMVEERLNIEEVGNGEAAMVEDNLDIEQLEEAESSDTAMVEDKQDMEQLEEAESSDTAMVEDKQDMEQLEEAESSDTAMVEDKQDNEEQLENSSTALLEDRLDEGQLVDDEDTAMQQDKHDMEQPADGSLPILEEQSEDDNTVMLEDKEQPPEVLENDDTAMRQVEEQREDGSTLILEDRETEEQPEKLQDEQEHLEELEDQQEQPEKLEDRQEQSEELEDEQEQSEELEDKQKQSEDKQDIEEQPEELENNDTVMLEGGKAVNEQETVECEDNFVTGFKERSDEVVDMEETPSREDETESKMDEDEEEQVVLYTPESQRCVATSSQTDNAPGTVECSRPENFPYDVSTVASLVDKITELSRLKQISRRDLKVLAASCNKFFSAYLDL